MIYVLGVASATMCSTPSDIRGYCTSQSPSPARVGSCAQRLVTSEVTALVDEADYLPERMCSTPSDIRGYCTSTHLDRCRVLPVLNA